MKSDITTNTNLSIILPCRNEESSIKDCVLKIKEVFRKNNINGEIIVSDSSTDRSPEIVRKLGVILIKHNKKGYGIACREGIQRATGGYIFIADPDCSYDFREIPRFLEFLQKDYDFVIGNRLTGRIEKGAMSWSHRYIGNPILSYTLKLLFNAKVGDAHCGMRAIKKDAYEKMKINSMGWEFAQEMVIKAKINNLRIKELSINYYRRKGRSKLHSLSDGLQQILFTFYYALNYYKNRIYI